MIIPLWLANLKYYQLETINGSCSGSQECLYYQVTHSNPPYQCHCTSNNESLSHMINTCTQTLNLLLEMKFQPRNAWYAWPSNLPKPSLLLDCTLNTASLVWASRLVGSISKFSACRKVIDSQREAIGGHSHSFDWWTGSLLKVLLGLLSRRFYKNCLVTFRSWIHDHHIYDFYGACETIFIKLA